MKKKKKICFEAFEHDYANLRIRLRYDKISQVEFFNLMIATYLSKNFSLLSLVEEYKTKNRLMGRRRAQESVKDTQRGFDILDDLGITPADREHLFDLIKGEED